MSEPRPGYLLSPRATILALSGVLLGMLLAALNQTIVATALPSITEDLGGFAHYSWVFSAYMLASTVTLPICNGRLSDIHGRRPFFALGIGMSFASMANLIVDAVPQHQTGGGHRREHDHAHRGRRVRSADRRRRSSRITSSAGCRFPSESGFEAAFAMGAVAVAAAFAAATLIPGRRRVTPAETSHVGLGSPSTLNEE